MFIRWKYNIGFGSDFDGILETVVNVSVYRDYENVMNELCKHYATSTVERFLYDNFCRTYEFLSFGLKFRKIKINSFDFIAFFKT